MNTLSCPECEAELSLEANTEIGEILVCPDCGVDLEVTSLDPAKVELATGRLGRIATSLSSLLITQGCRRRNM